MTESELLEYILVNLNKVDKVVFSADEVMEWPESLLSCFKKIGLIEEASPATIIDCNGCEQNCLMEVNILPAQNKLPARAFISCDKRDDIGRVPVELKSLQQWQVTSEALAKIIAKLLAINTPPRKQSNQKAWLIGTLKGKKKKDILLLASGDTTLVLSFAGHTIDVSDMLWITENGLNLDKNTLVQLVDHPKGANELPEDRKKRMEFQIAEEKKKGNRHFNKTVAAEEGISIGRLQQIINPPKKPSSDNYDRKIKR